MSTKFSSAARNQLPSAVFTSNRLSPASKRAIIWIYRRLFAAFGPQKWWPARSAFEVCVGAILTQNTAWPNVERAVTALRTAGLLKPARLARQDPTTLARLIRPAGCPQVKAGRLLAFADWLSRNGGFDALKHRSTAILRQSLLSVHGVGPETADSILLYALGRPVFVVDNYTRRTLTRYGLIHGNENYSTIQQLFHQSLPAVPYLFNEYHALLVQLGKTYCRPVPDCIRCPLAAV